MVHSGLDHGAGICGGLWWYLGNLQLAVGMASEVVVMAHYCYVILEWECPDPDCGIKNRVNLDRLVRLTPEEVYEYLKSIQCRWCGVAVPIYSHSGVMPGYLNLVE